MTMRAMVLFGVAQIFGIKQIGSKYGISTHAQQAS